MEFNLLAFRKASGMTQKELSKMSGVSVSTINKIESRKGDGGKMSTPKIIALSDALGVGIDFMIRGGNDRMTVGDIYQIKHRYGFSNEQVVEMFLS